MNQIERTLLISFSNVKTDVRCCAVPSLWLLMQYKYFQKLIVTREKEPTEVVSLPLCKPSHKVKTKKNKAQIHF